MTGVLTDKAKSGYRVSYHCIHISGKERLNGQTEVFKAGGAVHADEIMGNGLILIAVGMNTPATITKIAMIAI